MDEGPASSKAATLVDAASVVARFVFSGHLKKGRTLRWNAFDPPEQDLRLSVCVRDGLSTAEVHEWGRYYASRDEGPPKGFADLQVSAVLDQGLRVERDDDPPRHAEVAGWAREKERRMEIAKELLALAKLQLS